jgi:hypothetical protein
LDDYLVTVHHRYSNPVRINNYPLAQAKDLFPTVIAHHIYMTSGNTTSDPKLLWAVDLWRTMITPRNLRDDTQMDLNILSKLRTFNNNKKIKLTHLTTELIVEVKYGNKLNQSRNLKALIDTGSSGCIILNEFTKGIHHKQSENSQQWMTKGGLFKTNGICSIIKFYLPEFSTQESIKWKFHIDTSIQT